MLDANKANIVATTVLIPLASLLESRPFNLVTVIGGGSRCQIHVKDRFLESHAARSTDRLWPDSDGI
jgi:hypothetical protein